MAAFNALHKITVGEYHRMDAAGVFAPGSVIELIEGELVERLMPMNPPHAQAVTRLAHYLFMLLGERAYVRSQVPVTLGDLSEPQPDIAIVAMPSSLYDTRHPRGEEIYACIEVADTSRASDIARKVPLYATFEIPETWVVDLSRRQIRVFREPRDGAYADPTIVGFCDVVELLAFPGLPIDLGGVFL